MPKTEQQYWISSDLEDEPTLGERVEVARRERTQQALNNESRVNRPEYAPNPASNTSKKGRPREISSKKPVPVGRERCLGIDTGATKHRSVKKRFDPRFEDHCGELREEHVERNYSFVQGIRERRRQHLQRALKKNPSDYEVEHELVQMNEEDNRRKGLVRRREVLKKVREEEKEAVRRGKKPFFLKESALRKLEIDAKYKELKETGGVKKYIAKRRRRLAGKDRKMLVRKQQET